MIKLNNVVFNYQSMPMMFDLHIQAQEKIAIIQQTMEPGMTVSHVARLHGINANQIFKWRKQY